MFIFCKYHECLYFTSIMNVYILRVSRMFIFCEYHECLWDFVSVKKCNALCIVYKRPITYVFHVILHERVYL